MKGGLVRAHQEVRGSPIRIRDGKGGLFIAVLRYPGSHDHRGEGLSGLRLWKEELRRKTQKVKESLIKIHEVKSSLARVHTCR